MPQTPTFGFEYETPLTKPGITLTGDADGNAPILAEQVDTALASVDARLAGVENDIAVIEPQLPSDTGWIALDVIPAGGYTVTTSLYRQWGPVVSIHIILTRTGGAFPANSAGGITDTNLCTVNTIGARSTQLTYTAIQTTTTSGTALVNTNGVITIADMHANSVIDTTNAVRIMTTYFASTFN